jgi:hypothetical protein
MRLAPHPERHNNNNDDWLLDHASLKHSSGFGREYEALTVSISEKPAGLDRRANAELPLSANP